MTTQHKIRFFLKSLLNGLIYIAVLAVAYFLFKEFIHHGDQEVWLDRFYGNPILIYLIYAGSEVFFGLLPPELFMVWALHKGGDLQYWINLAFFAGVSYGAGYFGFLLGRYLKRALFFRYMSRKFFSRYWPLFRKYGSMLIVAAALTPLPWMTISTLVGTSEYPMGRFLFMALFRLFRFLFYGYVIFQTQHL